MGEREKVGCCYPCLRQTNQKASGCQNSSQLANLPSKDANKAMMMCLNFQGTTVAIKQVTKLPPLRKIITKPK